MLSMSRVPIDRWVRFILPVLLILLAIAFFILVVAINTNYS